MEKLIKTGVMTKIKVKPTRQKLTLMTHNPKKKRIVIKKLLYHVRKVQKIVVQRLMKREEVG
ncbi:unnamed protein product [Acanthoscelides obtectus]|uniref:Uncharacterized protein n=1 Tax=Acanthoscelides obtectus TaxID=200917 RepID=A0A9P0VTZ1_ACAOB|nr:unnamed protein product [Acanthoscelides obtectus]CAK1683634.1 hypothetical protein AOBTE_LOCUS34368 [Acanthoscelides obtectus]